MTIRGTEGRDLIMGTPGRDVITAGGGHDVVRGLDGDDLICGGAGRDRLLGGRGDDTLHGLSDADILKGGRGTDSLFGYAWYGAGENPDVAVDQLVGGRGGDGINFSYCPEEPFLCPIPDGGDDSSRGGRGDDSFGVCNDGQTSVSGGPGKDMAVFCSSVHADLSTQDARFEDGATVTLVGFEDLVGAAWASDTLIGDDGPNSILPGYDGQTDRGENDTMSGLGGDDSFGFGGSDSISGGDGDDRFTPWSATDGKTAVILHGDAGNDYFSLCWGGSSNPDDGWHYQLFGDEGTDTIEFGFGASVNLAIGEATCTDDTATVMGIERLVGSLHDRDVFIGSTSDDVLVGRGGDDYLDGREGHDLLRGGDGTDSCQNGERVSGCE
ncbi:MAG TPA: calcium-binding protein [Actinomycetota bacterium]|nr:calcium-binding protein [Actinomycetota bacterium]